MSERFTVVYRLQSKGGGCAEECFLRKRGKILMNMDLRKRGDEPWT
ncbi:MAG: hypothetical protein LBT22_04350 [Peptococcaceae bacterium]|jgi:hypothetical protein|nr:hypothetical protein [Peptococcaceae bacterium]